jgi:hypothetical protein
MSETLAAPEITSQDVDEQKRVYKIAHGEREFAGTVEQARRLCPIIGRMSVEDSQATLDEQEEVQRVMAERRAQRTAQEAANTQESDVKAEVTRSAQKAEEHEKSTRQTFDWHARFKHAETTVEKVAQQTYEESNATQVADSYSPETVQPVESNGPVSEIDHTQTDDLIEQFFEESIEKPQRIQRIFTESEPEVSDIPTIPHKPTETPNKITAHESDHEVKPTEAIIPAIIADEKKQAEEIVRAAEAEQVTPVIPNKPRVLEAAVTEIPMQIEIKEAGPISAEEAVDNSPDKHDDDIVPASVVSIDTPAEIEEPDVEALAFPIEGTEESLITEAIELEPGEIVDSNEVSEAVIVERSNVSIEHTVQDTMEMELENDAEIAEEPLAPTLRPEVSNPPEILIPELPAPIEAVENAITQLADELETIQAEPAEPETIVHKILEEIITLPEKVDASDAEIEIHMEQRLETLFTDLFEEAEIEYTPELIRSMVILTQANFFEDLLDSGIQTEEKNDFVLQMDAENTRTRDDFGAREFLQKLQHGLHRLRQAITDYYELGKSILRAYVSGNAGATYIAQT